MRIRLAIVPGLLAAAALPAAFAQRAHSAESVVVQRGGSYLGIGVEDIDSAKAKELKLKEERGALITSVTPDGPAAKAGIKEGDVVMEYNGTPVQGTEQLQRLVHETPAGREVRIVVSRNGALQTLTATVAEHKGAVITGPNGDWSFAMPQNPNFQMPQMPAMPEMPTVPNMPFFMQGSALGIYGEPLGQEPQLAEFFGVKEGVLVKSVTRNSPAAKAGIKAGDVIVKIDDSPISTTRDISMALHAGHGARTVTVVRNKKEMPIQVILEDSGNRVKASLDGCVYC